MALGAFLFTPPEERTARTDFRGKQDPTPGPRGAPNVLPSFAVTNSQADHFINTTSTNAGFTSGAGGLGAGIALIALAAVIVFGARELL